SALFYETKNGVLKINLEFFNTGSIPYKARARFDILNSSEIVFTGWSKEETLMPGEAKNFELFYYSSKTENLTSRLRIYYANEIIEKYFNLTLEKKKNPEDIFQVKNFRVYDNYLRFEVKANKSTKIFVIPSNFLPGCIFEQAEVELKENKNTEIILPFSCQVWFPHEITVEIVNEDGSYYHSNSFYLEKEKGLLKYVNLIIDKISVALNL
ncbi:MAG: hypothetical protein NZ942_02155, partial [Candidatus Aenigmarchaeota archaeon]|nr:hypothetical protein [Candidatus Aenigmarchaeota archaeon]